MAQNTSGWGRRSPLFDTLASAATSQHPEGSASVAQASAADAAQARLANAPGIPQDQDDQDVDMVDLLAQAVASADAPVEPTAVAASSAALSFIGHVLGRSNRELREDVAPADSEIKEAMHAEHRARQVVANAESVMGGFERSADTLRNLQQMHEHSASDLSALAVEQGWDRQLLNDRAFDLDRTAQSHAVQHKTGALHGVPFTPWASDAQISATITAQNFEDGHLALMSDAMTGAAADLYGRGFRLVSEKHPRPTNEELNAQLAKEGRPLIESNAGVSANKAGHQGDWLANELGPKLGEINAILRSQGLAPLEFEDVAPDAVSAKPAAGQAENAKASTPTIFAHWKRVCGTIREATEAQMEASHDKLRESVQLHAPSADRVKSDTLAMGDGADDTEKQFWQQRAERLTATSNEHPDKAAVEQRIAFEKALHDYQSDLFEHDGMSMLREQFGLPATEAPKIPKLLEERMVDALRSGATPSADPKQHVFHPEMDMVTNARFALDVAQIEASEKVLGPLKAQREAAVTTLADARGAHRDARERVEHLAELLPDEGRAKHMETLRHEVRVEGGYNLSPARAAAMREGRAPSENPAEAAHAATPLPTQAVETETASIAVSRSARFAPAPKEETPAEASAPAEQAGVIVPGQSYALPGSLSSLDRAVGVTKKEEATDVEAREVKSAKQRADAPVAQAAPENTEQSLSMVAPADQSTAPAPTNPTATPIQEPSTMTTKPTIPDAAQPAPEAEINPMARLGGLGGFAARRQAAAIAPAPSAPAASEPTPTPAPTEPIIAPTIAAASTTPSVEAAPAAQAISAEQTAPVALTTADVAQHLAQSATSAAMASPLERMVMEAREAGPAAEPSAQPQLGGLKGFAERQRERQAQNAAGEQGEGDREGKQQGAAAAAAPSGAKPVVQTAARSLDDEVDSVMKMKDLPEATEKDRLLAELTEKAMVATAPLRKAGDERWAASRAEQTSGPLTEDELSDPIAQHIRARHPHAEAIKAGTLPKVDAATIAERTAALRAARLSVGQAQRAQEQQQTTAAPEVRKGPHV